jgi:hypothetical protein
MPKAVIVYALVTTTLVAIAYGALCHSRFIKAGGQRGFTIVKSSVQTDAMKGPYRGMKIGYGMGWIAAALALLITGIWGPVR